MASGAIMSGLMAGANFGTGYQAGQQTSIQNTAMNKMNQIALDDAQVRQDQQKLALTQQKVLSDKAMELFNPMAPAGAPPVGPANQPGTDQPLTQMPGQGEQVDPSEKIDQLANFAASQGDLAHANELWTNSANLKTAKFQQAQKASAVQTADLKRQQLSHAYVAQTLGAATDEDSFNTAKMEVLSNPMVSPEEARNLANIHYSPENVDAIRNSGMTSSQQATAKLKDLEFQETKRTHAALEDHRDQALAQKTAHDQATEAAKKTAEKVGAAAKAPSANDIAASTAATKEAMGGDEVDTKDPAFLNARLNVAARANQIVRDNRAVTYPQAVSMAAQEAKRNGEFSKATTADTHKQIFGMRVPFTGQDASSKPSYKEKGAVPEDAIPYTGQPKSERVPGKFYHTGNGLMQWTGTGWKPQS